MSDKNINKKGWSTKWSEDENRILIDNYSKYSIEDLLHLFPNRNKKAIQQQAHKLGLKYLYYNENYFENIDNPDKAYWLGFIYADGYVSTNNRFGIELSIIDINHLEKIKRSINSNIKIRTRIKNGNEYCSILFKNKKIYEDLNNKGVIPNKTYDLKFPNYEIVPKKYIKDFIRGYFDGDGCYTFSIKERVRKDRNNKICKRLYKEINVVCYCKEFLEELRKTILNEIGCNFKLIKNRNTYVLRIFDKKNMISFINYIYYKDCLCLDRKKNKVYEILNYCLAH